MIHRDVLEEIFTVCLDIQQNTKYCAMVQYHGHVESLSVRIKKSKADFQKSVGDLEAYTHDELLGSTLSIHEVRDRLKAFYKEALVNEASASKQKQLEDLEEWINS